MVAIDRNFLGQIINTLKTVYARGWESMNALVDCVGSLMQIAQQPDVNIVEEEQPEEVEVANDGKDEHGEGI